VCVSYYSLGLEKKEVKVQIDRIVDICICFSAFSFLG
jgi:hypothetical protein